MLVVMSVINEADTIKIMRGNKFVKLSNLFESGSSLLLLLFSVPKELPRSKLRGICCHAGRDKPAPVSSWPGASSLYFWVPAFAGSTTRGMRSTAEPLNSRGIGPEDD